MNTIKKKIWKGHFDDYLDQGTLAIFVCSDKYSIAPIITILVISENWQRLRTQYFIDGSHDQFTYYKQDTGKDGLCIQ